jgi:predicted amidophosphoribosyltransferase
MPTIPSIFGPPNNNSRLPPAAPIVGVDGRLWCPACRGSLHKTRTPARCPECLQALEPRGHVSSRDLADAGIK